MKINFSLNKNDMNYKQKLTEKPKMRLRQKMRAVVTLSAISMLLIAGLIIYFQLSKVETVHAASASGDYRTAASGNWNSTATWQKYNGTSWIAAVATPTSAGGVIEIQSGHTVTVSASVTAAQLVVDAGGTLTINSGQTLTIANGPGTDISVNGTLTTNGTLSQNASSTMVINGTTTLASSGVHNLDSSCLVTINTGTYIQNGGTGTATSQYLVVNSGGTYQHNMDGGTVPPGTWNTGSTCSITGVISNLPAGLNQSFYNLTWNCTGQTIATSFTAPITVTGTLTINSTGTGQFKFYDPTVNTAGYYVQTGGYARLGGSAVRTLTVANDFTVSGGTFDFTDDASNGVLNVAGNFSLSAGTITETSGNGGVGNVYFNKSGTQLYTKTGGAISNSVNFTVDSASILSMGANILTGGGNFTLLRGGGLMMGDANGITSTGASGNVQVTGTRSFSTGADYTYNGSSAQNTGSGLPATVHNLTLNNSSGLALTKTVTVSNVLTLTSGIFTTNSNQINVTNTATASVTGYSPSSYIVGNLDRSVTGTASYDYPLGTSTNYEFININLSGATGFTDILGTFTHANPIANLLPLVGLLVNGASITDMLNYGYWTLTPNTTMTGGSYSVTLKEKGHTNSASSPGAYCVLKRHDVLSSWQSIGTHNNNTQSESGGVATAVRSGLTSFSHYGIGSGGGGALPIELLYFKAKYDADRSIVDFNWATASEINNDYFTVERSTDGKNFEPVLTKPGAGNSTKTLYYFAVDETTLKGTIYYRLKQTDYDGKFVYYDGCVIMIGENIGDAQVVVQSVGPNPFTNNFNINYSVAKQGEVKIQIANTSGQLVYKETMTADKGFNTYSFSDNQGLPSGIYIVSMIFNGEVVTKKIIKQ